MELPANKCYKEESYWDNRFENEESYDWFVGYQRIRDLINSTFKDKEASHVKILVLGESNFHCVKNAIEFSIACLKKLRWHYSCTSFCRKTYS